MKERIGYLDMVRGFALLLVMISHNGGVPFGGYYLMSYYIAVFFVLSGLTYYPNRNKAIWKRAKQLLIPYFCYNGFLLVVFMFQMFFMNDFSVGKVEKSIIGIFYSRNYIIPSGENYMNIWNAPLWFLTAFFLTFCLIEFIFRIKGIKTFQFKIIFLLLIVWYFLNKLPVLLPWSLDNVPLFAIFTYTAFWLKEPLKKIVKNTKLKIFVIFVFSIIYIAACNLNGGINLSLRNYGDYTGNKVIKVMLLFGICFLGSLLLILLLSILEKNILINKILSFVGKHTIDYLAIHLLVLHMVKFLLKSVGLVAIGGIQFWLVIAIQDILMIFCSTVWVLAKKIIKTKYS